jgi:hypothetical protein
MLLNEIVNNANYITDEEMDSNNLVGIANCAIAEINGKVSTKLPFFTENNVSTKPYNAITPTWILRLIEPYLSYSIAANDTDSDMRDFHYNRFLQAINDFKEKGLDDVLKIDPETGEETGYAGNSATMVDIDRSDFKFYWMGM